MCHEHQGRFPPPWMADLDDEDVSFIKRFVLASGSLKEIASEYGVSYPTVRLRLDRLIQKIRVSDATEADPYVALIKRLAADERIDFTAAKVLIKEYRKQGKGGFDVAIFNAWTLMVLFAAVLVFAGLVALQAFLSKREAPGWRVRLAASRPAAGKRLLHPKLHGGLRRVVFCRRFPRIAHHASGVQRSYARVFADARLPATSAQPHAPAERHARAGPVKGGCADAI